MTETLTLHRLRVPDQLRRTLSSTNVIEPAFSIVETVCRNVKRWRDGDQIERWVGSGQPAGMILELASALVTRSSAFPFQLSWIEAFSFLPNL